MRKGKQDSTNALRRQWTLVRRIPRHPVKKTVAHLAEALAAEGFQVEKRTVERDLRELQEIFPTIECDDREKPYGWSWAKSAPGLHAPGLTSTEALAFQMLERFIKPLLPDSVLEALQPYVRVSAQVLKETPGVSASSWTRKVRVVHPTQLLIPPHVDPAVHRTVTDGLLQDRQIEVVYRRRSTSDTVTRVVNPLALVQRGPITYLVVSQSMDPFYLAMHRISKAAILEAHAARPPGFDIDEHIAAGHMGFDAGARVRLELLVNNEIAAHLSEAPLSTDQRIGSVIEGRRSKVTATVPHNQQLEWWLMGFGAEIEVLKPLSLRKKIKDAASALARLYS